MRSTRLLFGAILSVSVVSALVIGTPAASLGATRSSRTSTPQNVDVSQRHGNESETTVAINPTNPQNVVIVSNVQHPLSGMFEGVSFDGGTTWATKLIGHGDNLGDACCDPSLSFDNYGNLFLTYLFNRENTIPVALSTDGGISFGLIAKINGIPKRQVSRSGHDDRGLFQFTDQGTITAAEGEVWVVVNVGGPMGAFGAPVHGLGQVGSFDTREVIEGTNNCTYGDVAIGPEGQVMNVCTLTESGQGGGKLFVNVDPDGLGPAPFGKRVFVADTHVGGFDFIPPQPDRSVDAEPGLAWDRTGGAHAGRAYLVYTLEQKNESDNTDIYVQHSDDDGATWTDPVRVNDDHTTNSQFLPKIALDQTSGDIAVTWYDSRLDLGNGGPGDTDGVPNDDAQYWGAFSTDGGSSFTPNLQISAGTSNSADANNGIDYGDYTGLAFFEGIARPAWADNSNSTGTNPDGRLNELDIYTAAVPVRG